MGIGSIITIILLIVGVFLIGKFLKFAIRTIIVGALFAAGIYFALLLLGVDLSSFSF